MNMLTRSPRVVLALTPIGPVATLLLERWRPFGAGGWQDFVMGLPLGIGLGAALCVLFRQARC